VRATGVDARIEGFIVELDLEYSELLGYYVVRSLTIASDEPEVSGANGSREINGVLLRQLPVQEFIRTAGQLGAMLPSGYYHPDRIVDREPELLEEARRRGPSERLLWSTAFVYRSAEIWRESPAKYVEAAFALQPRTASNWIRRAREAGMFERDAPDPADG
jgi:hypothetical protein